MKKIAILTGGGDAPGLNAVIRAVVKTAVQQYGCQVLGVRNGFDGFIDEGGLVPLGLTEVRGILPRGGTILGAANRGNPFVRKIVRDGVEVVEDTSNRVLENINKLGLDGLIVVGGDGTLQTARDLYHLGVPVVGVPKTIDNDIGETDFTFGFDTALNTAMEAIDKLHSTAESHHRVMVLELMGRDAGYIALYAGIAGGADVILIPEIPFHYNAIISKIKLRVSRGAYFSIIAVAEGAHPAGGDPIYARGGDEVFVPRLGGIGAEVMDVLARTCGIETRVTVLGHLQRGGSPSAFDRTLCTRMGGAAVRLVVAGKFGRMVALSGGEVVDVSLQEALAHPRRIDLNSDIIWTARGMGICLGDE